jgi:hypothetical protein
VEKVGDFGDVGSSLSFGADVFWTATISLLFGKSSALGMLQMLQL